MSGRACGCKVGRSAEKYGLTDLDDHLRERRQTGASLRELADFINRRILRAGIEAEGTDRLAESTLFGAIGTDDVVETVYETLVGETSGAERVARVRTVLERSGVDIEELEGDWVTHPTVRGHLRDCLGEDTSAPVSMTPEDGLNTIEWARSRSTGVVETTVSRMRSADLLSITEPEVDVSIRVTCRACNASYSPTELVAGGGCECDRDG